MSDFQLDGCTDIQLRRTSKFTRMMMIEFTANRNFFFSEGSPVYLAKPRVLRKVEDESQDDKSIVEDFPDA